ncbi:alpha-2,3-sialyltransferase [Psittacicella hinzii]|uniref:Alpha-2,3-sialyltransferase n=1 Tax=Psittacicella hinzii TaxID=2028575 RepID=A0A3A1YJQ5_9GAMM|nr:alpha-2,3-sialyltransferase [Psittacicella hinzii]RIY37895.1 hypothetical protein CKF58_04525 [Psittacicella hinzii]
MIIQKEKKIKRTSDNVIICGNGPSLRTIDYDRLPTDYDVFRCNQFYFEDCYFIGKKVKAAFFTPNFLWNQYLTTQKLIENQEYDIEHIVTSTFNNPLIEPKTLKEEISYLVDVIDGYDAFLSHYLDIDIILIRYEIFEHKRITSGVYMILAAMACGYKNIYIAGIDFYQDDLYAFDTAKTNILSLVPNIDKKEGKSDTHSLNFDMHIIQYLRDHYNLNLFSLCPTSYLSQHIPFIFNDNCKQPGDMCNFNVEKKQGEWTKDIVLLPETVKWRIRELSGSNQEVKDSRDDIYQNIYYKLIMDLVRLPRLYKKYCKKKKKGHKNQSTN